MLTTTSGSMPAASAPTQNSSTRSVSIPGGSAETIARWVRLAASGLGVSAVIGPGEHAPALEQLGHAQGSLAGSAPALLLAAHEVARDEQRQAPERHRAVHLARVVAVPDPAHGDAGAVVGDDVREIAQAAGTGRGAVIGVLAREGVDRGGRPSY